MYDNSFFDRQAVLYDIRYEGFDLNVYEKWYQRRRLNRVVDVYCSILGKRVLDVGCGSGNLLDELRGWCDVPFVGFDLSRSMIEISKSKKISDCLFYVDSVTGIHQESCSFDFVMCIGVLPYVEDIDVALKELYRVLEDGGYLVVTYPYDNFFVNFFRKNKLGLYLRKNVLKMASFDLKYSVLDFEDMCKKKGFRMVDKKKLKFSEYLYVMQK